MYSNVIISSTIIFVRTLVTQIPASVDIKVRNLLYGLELCYYIDIIAFTNLLDRCYKEFCLLTFFLPLSLVTEKIFVVNIFIGMKYIQGFPTQCHLFKVILFWVTVSTHA